MQAWDGSYLLCAWTISVFLFYWLIIYIEHLILLSKEVQIVRTGKCKTHKTLTVTVKLFCHIIKAQFFTDTILCNHLEAMEQFSIHKVSLVLPRAAVMEYECNLLNSAHSGIHELTVFLSFTIFLLKCY